MVHIHSNQEKKIGFALSLLLSLSLSLSCSHQTRSTMTNAPVVSPLGTPTEHDNLKGVDRLRQKFRPALLYVVSLVEFINIGMYLIYFTVKMTNDFLFMCPRHVQQQLMLSFFAFLPFFLFQSTARRSLLPSSQSHKISNSR